MHPFLEMNKWILKPYFLIYFKTLKVKDYMIWLISYFSYPIIWTTWSNHIQLLCLQYGLPSPLSVLLGGQACSKEAWSNLVKTRVTIWHEKKLRRLSLSNSKTIYLNIQLHGLSGRPHPTLQNINTTRDAQKLRLHLKFLTCDFLTNERIAID